MTIRPAVGKPDPREQLAGLTFAVLLVGPDLTISEANPAAENLLGRSAQRLVGETLLSVVRVSEGLIGEKLLEDEAQIVARGLKIGAGSRDLDVNLTVSPMPNHVGWRVVTLSEAGTGDRLAEDEAGRGLHAPAVLAHEIKNPLAAIRGAAQLIARQLAKESRTLTDLIVDEVDRIAQLIDRMQRLGRERAEPVTAINLHAAIRRAWETVAAAGGPAVTLREEFDPSLPPVLANEGALVQVLINLLSNARDAAAQVPDPEIVIQTRFVSGFVTSVRRLGRPVKLPIEVMVADNGPGIDPALRADIFEPFVSSKKNGQGLGLALVRKLVSDMDGRIGHARDEGAGMTQFRVHLPVGR